MKDNIILEHLQSLGGIKASNKLHKKIDTQSAFLQPKYRGFYFPLFAFRTGLALSVIAVLLLAGSGLVWAAKLSNPGTPLYPIKQAIQTIAPQFIHPEVIPTIVPQSQVIPTSEPLKASPTPTKTHYSITGAGEDGQEREGSQGGERESEVEGISTVQPTNSFQQKIKQDVKKQIKDIENTGEQFLNNFRQDSDN